MKIGDIARAMSYGSAHTRSERNTARSAKGQTLHASADRLCQARRTKSKRIAIRQKIQRSRAGSPAQPAAGFDQTLRAERHQSFGRILRLPGPPFQDPTSECRCRPARKQQRAPEWREGPDGLNAGETIPTGRSRQRKAAWSHAPGRHPSTARSTPAPFFCIKNIKPSMPSASASYAASVDVEVRNHTGVNDERKPQPSACSHGAGNACSGIGPEASCRRFTTMSPQTVSPAGNSPNPPASERIKHSLCPVARQVEKRGVLQRLQQQAGRWRE